MHIGVVATASHVVSIQTRFEVYYKPRTSPFIIGLNKYIQAVNNGFTVGMRFNMRFEGEDSPERRFTGTIVGVEDISIQCNCSKCRSLKVQWDEPASLTRPERVSPWEIETFVAPVPTSIPQPVAPKTKRPRPPMEIPNLEPTCSTVSIVWNPSHDSSQLSCTPKGQRVDKNRCLLRTQMEIPNIEKPQAPQSSIEGGQVARTLSTVISDKEQEKLHVSPKEVQRKQTTCTTRSRTKLSSKDEPKLLRASDVRVSSVYRETDQPSKLQIRDEVTKWSFPVQIEKEDTIFLVSKKEDGTHEILRTEIRGYEEGSRFIVVICRGPRYGPIRIENRTASKVVRIRLSVPCPLKNIHILMRYLNLGVKLPKESLKPNMAPKIYIDYAINAQELERGDSADIKIIRVGFHLVSLELSLGIIKKTFVDIYYGDMQVNVLVDFPTVTSNRKRIYESKKKQKAQDQKELDMDNTKDSISEKVGLKKQKETLDVSDLGEEGVVWDIFRRDDTPKLHEYLKKHFKEFKDDFGRPLQQRQNPKW
ncbi:unnamed protein product [Lactuca virosa]|uniref:Auxin response factor domain-containing protein n=1 Tax=Lactuca virosa TaxID=75947 RepID=A0AAU9MT65_9ASTR|nr:unnamed protein product [Lactuca virosa]